MTTQIELLAAVLSGSKRRPIFALNTTIYPIISMEDNPIVGSISVSDTRGLTLIFETPLIGGSVSVEEITRQTVLIAYEEAEKEITSSLSVESIDKAVVLIEYEETEQEITGSLSVIEIIQTVVLVQYDEAEKEITGSVSVESITKV